MPEKRLYRWLVKVYSWAAEWLYHPFAWTYDLVAWLISFGRWAQWRRDGLDYLRPGTILEVGFGTGELLCEMADKGLDVTGLDESRQMQRVTRHKLTRRGFHVQQVRGRSETLPFHKGAFDNLIVTFPSNYIARDETLEAFYRVLKGGGRVIAAGLTIKFTRRWRNRLTARLMDDAAGRFVTHLVEKAEKQGFLARIVSHEGRDYIQPILILEKPDENQT